MGREVRLVPADWEHPKDAEGEYVPLHAPRSREQDEEEREMFAKGFRRRFAFETDEPEWIKLRPEMARLSADEYYGAYRPECHMDFGGRPATHLQMYETCSEGSPISPVFATAEALADWLAETGASAFGSMTATRDEWLATIKAGSVVSAAIVDGRLMSGVEAEAK